MGGGTTYIAMLKTNKKFSPHLKLPFEQLALLLFWVKLQLFVKTGSGSALLVLVFLADTLLSLQPIDYQVLSYFKNILREKKVVLPISIVNVSNFCNLSHTAKLQEALVDNCNLYEMFNLLHES